MPKATVDTPEAMASLQQRMHQRRRVSFGSKVCSKIGFCGAAPAGPQPGGHSACSLTTPSSHSQGLRLGPSMHASSRRPVRPTKLARVPCLRKFVAYPIDCDYTALPRKPVLEDGQGQSHPARPVPYVTNAGQSTNLNNQTSLHPIHASLKNQHGRNCYKQGKHWICKYKTDRAIGRPLSPHSSHVSRRQSSFVCDLTPKDSRLLNHS